MQLALKQSCRANLPILSVPIVSKKQLIKMAFFLEKMTQNKFNAIAVKSVAKDFVDLLLASNIVSKKEELTIN